jgi:predicted Zn-dependent protease
MSEQETVQSTPENTSVKEITSETNPEEYSQLKHDLEQIIGRGLDGMQEKAPGRVIENVTMRLQGRYGIVVRTNDRGLIEVPEMCGFEMDNQGRSKRQRMFIGMNCSASTKKTSFGSLNLLKRGETTVKEFEANAGAYELLKRTVEHSQKQGEEFQRKIDEEEKECWCRKAFENGKEMSQNGDKESSPNVDQVFNLITLARQTLKKELGSKLDTCKIAFFWIVDTMELTDTNKNKLDLAVPRTGFTIQVKTAKGHQCFDAVRGTGGMSALLRYNKDMTPEQVVENMAMRVAKRCIDMDRAQSSSVLGGEAWIVMDGEIVGVLAHEVLGHASEADIILENKKNKDAELNLKSRLGGQVSENQAFSVIDDGNFEVQLGNVKITNCFGSLCVDEDGFAPLRTNLVKNGIQINALTSADTFNEVTSGLPEEIKSDMEAEGPSGNLRNERFDKIPMVRMTNTFVLPNEEGPDTVEELATMVPKSKKGVYVVNCSGGWVEPDSGNFQVTGQLGYLIENGQITDKPVKDVIIRGNISKFGSKIKKIGSSNTIHRTGSGFCGKDSQWVPVDDGGPAILVEDVLVGKEQPSRYWNDTYVEYCRQMKEVSVGKRKRSEVFFKFLDDDSEEEEKTKTYKHHKLCLMRIDMPIDDEIEILLGNQPITAKYALDKDGKLEEV